MTLRRVQSRTGFWLAFALGSVAFVSIGTGCNAKPKKSPSNFDSNTVEAVVDPGCPHRDGGTCAHGHEPKAVPPSGSTDAAIELFGQSFDNTKLKEVPLENILSSPQQFHQKQVLVSGHVQRACSRRGCWMELAPNSSSEEGCRVTFKDYGFLVPTDSEGREARLVGEVQVTVIPASAVEHYESEGGTFKNKQPDGTAREVRIVATGVELSPKS